MFWSQTIPLVFLSVTSASTVSQHHPTLPSSPSPQHSHHTHTHTHTHTDAPAVHSHPQTHLSLFARSTTTSPLTVPSAHQWQCSRPRLADHRSVFLPRAQTPSHHRVGLLAECDEDVDTLQCCRWLNRVDFQNTHMPILAMDRLFCVALTCSVQSRLKILPTSSYSRSKLVLAT